MGEPMPALTVRPPWSWAIAHGGKAIENRSYPTRYRGQIAIHGGALSRWDPDGERSPRLRLAWREWIAALPAGNVPTPLPSRRSLHISFGAVVAVAELAGCHSSGPQGCGGEWDGVDGWLRPWCSTWAANGQCHWELADVRPLRDPVPCRGMLGLWRLPDEVEKAVRAQLGEDGNHG